MSTVLRPPVLIPQKNAKSLRSLVKYFLDWCSDQQVNRIGWQSLALVVFGAVLTPITIIVSCISGVNLFLILTSIVAMQVNLITALSAMPTKISIPAFFIGVIVDFIIIITCVLSIIKAG